MIPAKSRLAAAKNLSRIALVDFISPSLIQECLAGRMRKVARRAGAGHSTTHTWISRYRAEGASALCENGNTQKRTYSEEIQQKAVEEYLSGQGSSMAIAEKYKLRSGNLVLDWVKKYDRRRKSSKETGVVSMAGRKHSLEERAQAVREYLEAGKSFSELSETYGAAAQVVRNWVKRYQEMGAAGLEDRRGKRLASRMPRIRAAGASGTIWHVTTIPV